MSGGWLRHGALLVQIVIQENRKCCLPRLGECASSEKQEISSAPEAQCRKCRPVYESDESCGEHTKNRSSENRPSVSEQAWRLSNQGCIRTRPLHIFSSDRADQATEFVVVGNQFFVLNSEAKVVRVTSLAAATLSETKGQEAGVQWGR